MTSSFYSTDASLGEGDASLTQEDEVNLDASESQEASTTETPAVTEPLVTEEASKSEQADGAENGAAAEPMG